MRRLAQRIGPLATVRVPRYSHVAADGSFGGDPLAPGAPLTNLRFDSLPAGDRPEIARQLAGLLSLIHTLSIL